MALETDRALTISDPHVQLLVRGSHRILHPRTSANTANTTNRANPSPPGPFPKRNKEKTTEETNRTPTAHRVHALLDDDAERLGRHRAVPPSHVHVADLGVVGEVRERDRVDVE